MRIAESQLRRIVREEILRENMDLTSLRGVIGRRLEITAPVSRWVNELGRKLVVLPAGSIVNLYDVAPTHSVPGITRGSTPAADRLASESPYNVVVLEVEVVHGGVSNPVGSVEDRHIAAGALLGRGDMARITVLPDEVRVVG